MTTVLHVPGNIEILAHSLSDDIRLAETGLRPPIRPESVLQLPSWSDFDVLHLHTVEFTDADTLDRLGHAAKQAGKRLVFTMHELRPNIESDVSAFDDKTRRITAMADKVLTLSEVALQMGSEQFGIPKDKMLVVPHGQPFAQLVTGTPSPGVRGIAAYGAMRTHRQYANLVRAWKAYDVATRPPLQLWIRSVAEFDENFYKDDLTELRKAADEEPDFKLRIRPTFIPTDELTDWLKPVDTLALPYDDITHSGQLELGLDLGLKVIAPDIATLRSQVAAHPRAESHTFFADAAAINDPKTYADVLATVSEHAIEDLPDALSKVRAYRSGELNQIKARHRHAYGAIQPAI